MRRPLGSTSFVGLAPLARARVRGDLVVPKASDLRLRQRFPVGLGTVEIAWIRP